MRSVLLISAFIALTTSQSAFAQSSKSVVRQLRANGVSVERIDTVSQPFFSVKAAVYRIDGGELQVYNYRSASAAAKEAGRVAPNGAIGGAMPRWIAPPHFFRKGRVMAIYLGSSDKALKALTRVMGPQFAGK